MWGSDFAFLDKNDQPIGDSWCTRNSDGIAMETFFRDVIKREDYFAFCGGQIRRGNTTFQLYERYLKKDTALQDAQTFLMLPDYMGYLFTGRKYTEFTIGTTSQLIDPFTGKWNEVLIRKLNLSPKLFCEIIMPGTARYPIRQDLQQKLNTMAQYVPVTAHDTASAVTTLQIQSDEVFCSSGTWSIIGIECEQPIISREAYEANFSNEGTAKQSWRFQKDVMGMWCIQNLFKRYRWKNPDLTWEMIIREAEMASPFRSIVNLEESVFAGDGDPLKWICRYCEKTEQPIPLTLGEAARCIYESMALRYWKTIHQLQKISGRKIRTIRIVGGGAKNQLLNQMLADVTNMRVEAGPYESACIGNILMQASADGSVQQKDFSKIVKNSFDIQTFVPKKECSKEWLAATERYECYSCCMHL